MDRYYYAVFDGKDYLDSGMNSRTRGQVKQEILSLVEPETDPKAFHKMKKWNLRKILGIYGWHLERQTTRFLTPTLH